MKILLATVAPDTEGEGIDRGAYEKLLDCYRQDRFREHTLTDSPEDADLIIFAELGFPAAMGLFDSNVRRHPYVRQYRDKCFVINPGDRIIPFLPGIYASVEQRWFDERRVRSGHYLSTHLSVPPQINSSAGKDFLFSFVGAAANDPVRSAIMGLEHARGYCRDTSAASITVWSQGTCAVRQFQADYADVMARSKFILCPRGCGASSIRLFEAMRAGVAPVIISDAWVPPTGPDWKSFSLRVPEDHVRDLPSMLEEHESRSEEMGRRARLEWDTWFSDEVSFHRVVGWCQEIAQSRTTPEHRSVARLLTWLQIFRPYHFRVLLRHLASAVRRSGA